MDRPSDFVLGTSDPEVSALLRDLPEVTPNLDRRFTQEEEYYLFLDRPFVVEPFDIHHDVDSRIPTPKYLSGIRSLVQNWTQQIPSVFRGLQWFFDPKDLFHPLFVQVFTAREKRYLVLMRPDLTFRGRHAEVLERGGNDVTPRWSSRSLFMECELLPLETWESSADEKKLYLAKLWKNTFQGESGRGYFREGRWIDQEITKILSRAALPPGFKTFPHYPLRCRHGTISVRCVTPTSEGRKRAAATVETAWPLVSAVARHIYVELMADPFREDHPLLELLRNRWSHQLSSKWGEYRLEPYLNSQDQKEYRYHGA